MELRNVCDSRKQIVFFSTLDQLKECTDDVIKVWLPHTHYSVHNLNFVTRFLDNNPPIQQQLILHWSRNRIQAKAYHLDVFEIIAFYQSFDEEIHEAHYLIPVPVLFSMLGIRVKSCILQIDEASRDNWITNEDMAADRCNAYNEIIKEYCSSNGVSFHPIDKLVRKDNKYMKEMEAKI